VVYGTSEVAIKVDEGEKRRRHAIHEAGHALISHLDSKDRLPPSYCSVLKHDDLHARVRHQMTQVIDLYRASFKLATTKGSTGRLGSVF
jgi:hypothetical protein